MGKGRAMGKRAGRRPNRPLDGFGGRSPPAPAEPGRPAARACGLQGPAAGGCCGGRAEAHGRPGKGKAGGERAARRALRRSRSRRPEAAETAAGGLPCGPCPRMAQRPGMGFYGGSGWIGKLKECLLPFTVKMCYNISSGNFPKK